MLIAIEIWSHTAMEYISPLFTDLRAEESASVNGGTQVNFDLNTYLFIIGAGVVFDGGLSQQLIDFAFQSSIYTDNNSSSGSGKKHSKKHSA